jgi:exopolyphosphatase/guanosine-5'-triphosphate,3'-diphosphate pyrophosphatase
MSELVAAVDCGTNTTRLLISDGTTDVVRLHRITGLGRGLSGTGVLASDAIGRVEEALSEFGALLEAHGVSRCRAIATSAARDAPNAKDFFDVAERALGHRLELIPGSVEGSLSFAGATSGLDVSRGPFLVVDIGGGSTEFAVGSSELSAVLSLDMGSVRFTEMFVEHDPPRPEELSNMLQVIEAHLDDVKRDLPGLAGAATVIAVAGTATTVAAIEIGLQVYDADVINDFELTRAAAEDVFRTLATEPFEARVHNPGLERERADVIVAGSAILVGVMRYLGIESLVVRDHDILDGLVLSQLG